MASLLDLDNFSRLWGIGAVLPVWDNCNPSLIKPDRCIDVWYLAPGDYGRWIVAQRIRSH